MADGNTSKENTLRLGQRELLKLVQAMDDGSDAQTSSREHVRWEFAKTRVELTVNQPGGSRQTMIVATRNLSRRGIGVLHSAYVYPKSVCEICFTLDDGERISVAGEVMRCTHVDGRVHDVGIRLQSEISTRDVLGLDPMLEAYSLEHVEPGSLHGTVLLMAGSELEQQILVRALEETNLTILVAEDEESAIQKIERGVDLMLCDSFLTDGSSGVDLVAELRGSGFDSPVIVMGSADAGQERDDIRMSGANGFLSKPVSAKRVLQALAEFLLGGGDGSPMYTSLSRSDPAMELMETFLRELPRLALELENSMKDNDLNQALRVCRVLQGTGEPLGFAELSELGARAERALTKSANARAGCAELRTLMIACRRVKYRKTGS